MLNALIWTVESCSFFHYSMLYCPVLIVKGVVLDRHCVCSCAWLQEMLKKKRKRAQAQSFSTLLSTSCGFKSIVALTQSKHRKCQHLFTESFVQRRKKTKYFLFVKQNTRMCRARDDQKMTSTYHHSLSRHYKAPPPHPPISCTMQGNAKTLHTLFVCTCRANCCSLLKKKELTNTITGLPV